MPVDRLTFRTPLGNATLALDGDVLLEAIVEGPFDESSSKTIVRPPADASPAARRVVEAFRRYFEGDPRSFDEVRTRAEGTPFQQQVWAALRKIPAGRVETYGGLAKALGCPGGARAVGRACATNPIWVVVPCHRVVGADGDLTGYAGGRDRKAWLLEHEALAVGPLGATR